MAGRGDRRDNRDQNEIPDGECRIGERKKGEADGDDGLAEADPALPPSEPFEPRQLDSIDNRRPEEFERVSEAYP